MLETRNLCKIYKPKKGVPVTALNNVSLKFGDKGMVFLLGKSGSGKSTLLNLLGGLDKYNSGEIIIKGVSSKDFKQSHFDSYRNTYVGFIFQEYNILDEFSVGANIALALELQGRKATDEAINSILKEVDLEGFGNRKPNELSGGQKQRVAIARALVKNPKIIMADEPTGALDSNTGRQVFDTLKKLSKEKLVIIVSHDREFSEYYADRIIELADGNVISDVTVDTAANEAKENLSFNEDVIEIAKGYHLTEEDRIAINEYIEKLESMGQSAKLGLPFGKKIKFRNTDSSDIIVEDKSEFKLIKSKLPLKNAFKIGASSLKHKKFRLVMTILLSCVAFVLFGLADTFASYNHVKSTAKSFIDTGLEHLTLRKAIKYGEGMDSYWDSYDTTISKEDIESLEKEFGISFTGVVEPAEGSLGFENYDHSVQLSETYFSLYSNRFSGYAEVTENTLKDMGYEIIAGKLPDGSKNEIAISKYMYRIFEKAKYADFSGYYDDPENFVEKYEEIKSCEDIIGKKLWLGVENTEYVITAVIDTHFDEDRYAVLTEESDHMTAAEDLAYYALMTEYYAETEAGFAQVLMVGEGFTDKIIAEKPKTSRISNSFVVIYPDSENSFEFYPDYAGKLSDIDADDITWLDGERTELAENEVIISESAINYYEINDFASVVDMKLEDYVYTMHISSYFTEENYNESGVKVVGILDAEPGVQEYTRTVIVNDNMFSKIVDESMEVGEYISIVAAMPKDLSDIEKIVAYCYDEDSNIQYHAQNAVSYELDMVNEVLNVLAKVFMYIGIGFAVFASLMLANFIGQSISYKKQEIGILRAIGSRGNDVFRIFFSESFIIAMINFVISSVGVFSITSVMNSYLRMEAGLLITIINFGPRQLALLFAISVGVAFIASYLPVKKIASKRPIDAIRNR